MLDPRGKGFVPAWVDVAELRLVFKHSRWKFHNLQTAVALLSRPDQIWLALRRADEEEVLGYAYVGVPQAMRDGEGEIRPFPSARVFVVFLDLRMTLVEWRMEAAPAGGFSVGERFKELLWSR